ncbi:MAG: anti-sigma factor antagonist [Deltaproteobacteria bacterium]|jgi:hypothetical protein|nr:anti-sigma factor antagonist [Deltaproteobacteria bacterium]
MRIYSPSPESERVSLRAEGDVVTLRGEIDQASQRVFLGPFFEEIHRAAESEGLRVVKVDVRGLRFLNSSAVKELIAWVLKRNHMAPAKKYVIEFIYDSTVLWQRVTLPTLSHLDADFIVLDDRSQVAGNA